MTNPTIRYNWGTIEGIALALYGYQVMYWAVQQAQHDRVSYSDYHVYVIQ